LTSGIVETSIAYKHPIDSARFDISLNVNSNGTHYGMEKIKHLPSYSNKSFEYELDFEKDTFVIKFEGEVIARNSSSVKNKDWVVFCYLAGLHQSLTLLN